MILRSLKCVYGRIGALFPEDTPLIIEILNHITLVGILDRGIVAPGSGFFKNGLPCSLLHRQLDSWTQDKKGQ